MRKFIFVSLGWNEKYFYLEYKKVRFVYIEFMESLCEILNDYYFKYFYRVLDVHIWLNAILICTLSIVLQYICLYNPIYLSIVTYIFVQKKGKHDKIILE